MQKMHLIFKHMKFIYKITETWLSDRKCRSGPFSFRCGSKLIFPPQKISHRAIFPTVSATAGAEMRYFRNVSLRKQTNFGNDLRSWSADFLYAGTARISDSLVRSGRFGCTCCNIPTVRRISAISGFWPAGWRMASVHSASPRVDLDGPMERAPSPVSR